LGLICLLFRRTLFIPAELLHACRQACLRQNAHIHLKLNFPEEIRDPGVSFRGSGYINATVGISSGLAERRRAQTRGINCLRGIRSRHWSHLRINFDLFFFFISSCVILFPPVCIRDSQKEYKLYSELLFSLPKCHYFLICRAIYISFRESVLPITIQHFCLPNFFRSMFVLTSASSCRKLNHKSERMRIQNKIHCRTSCRFLCLACAGRFGMRSEFIMAEHTCS
jgi:hypothetical protein